VRLQATHHQISMAMPKTSEPMPTHSVHVQQLMK